MISVHQKLYGLFSSGIFIEVIIVNIQQNNNMLFNKLSLYCIAILILLFTYAPAHAQISNVEAQRVQTDSTGWAGSLSGNFNFTKNTVRIFSAKAFAAIQYKTEKNTYLLLGDYGLLKTQKRKLVNNAFLHLRFDHKFTNLIRWEFFIQEQTNEITKIDRRFLVGTGPRFKLPAPDNLKTYLGILFMHEYEKEITHPPITHQVFRNSSYFTLLFAPSKHLKLVSTTYYQPRLGRFSDFRILNKESAKFSITKKLSLILNWDYSYDSSPVIGVPKSNYTFSSGIQYVFNPDKCSK
jgi:hypothetical protein